MKYRIVKYEDQNGDTFYMPQMRFFFFWLDIYPRKRFTLSHSEEIIREEKSQNIRVLEVVNEI